MESRVEKFKQHRLNIKNQGTNDDLDGVLNEEDLKNQDEKFKKKNTLAMSIDQILEANDEYTTIIQQKTLEEKLAREKKLNRDKKVKKIIKIGAIALALIGLLALLTIIIFKIL